MGRAKRIIPEDLGKKLEFIRNDLGLTLDDMVKRLDCSDIPLRAASIYEYEKNRREPPLSILVKYAKIAGIFVDNLIDDELELFEKIERRKPKN